MRGAPSHQEAGGTPPGRLALRASPTAVPRDPKAGPCGQNRRTPNQDVLKSPGSAQDRPASSLLPHVSPLNAIWAFQLPASSPKSLAPAPHPSPSPWPPAEVSPRGGSGSINCTEPTPPHPRSSPNHQVVFSNHTGSGLGPGAPVAVGLEQSATGEHPAWMVGAARDAAPSPVGCSWSFPGAGEDGVGRGGGAPVPAQGRTRRVPTHSPQSGCRVASSSFSQSPSQSGRRGLCPSSPAPCQRVSQPRAG